MKYAILFAFAVFAFLAQADAKIALEEYPKSVDRGAIAEALREKLYAAKKKLDEMLNEAQEALKDKLTEAKEKAEHLIEQLKEKAHLITDKVFVAAQEMLDKVDTKVNASLAEIQTKSHAPVEHISDCMIMKDTFHMAAMALIANVSSCITDKIEEGESYVVDIVARIKIALYKIKMIKEETQECVQDHDDIGKISNAIGCVAKASAKGTLVIGKTIPLVSIDIAKLIFEISTLQATLPICISNNALLTLSQETEHVVASVTKCTKEKLECELKGITAEETEQITEEEQNNEVVDKQPQV